MRCECVVGLRFDEGLGIVMEKEEENVLTTFVLFDRRPTLPSLFEVCPFCSQAIQIDVSALTGKTT